jgi:hypothetical protein
MKLSTKPKQKPDYYLEMMDGELLLYHLDETKILYCNQTASLIWYLCDGQRTVGQMIDILGDAYPEAAGTMASDVEETIGQFLATGCIELL